MSKHHLNEDFLKNKERNFLLCEILRKMSIYYEIYDKNFINVDQVSIEHQPFFLLNIF